jgi:hypothetical protein
VLAGAGVGRLGWFQETDGAIVMAKKKTPKKKAGTKTKVTKKKTVKKKKVATKKTVARERTLTSKDREKIQRLLETADPDNARLAFSLLEETASDEDVDAILSDDVILPLAGSGELQILVRTGQLALGAESAVPDGSIHGQSIFERSVW